MRKVAIHSDHCFSSGGKRKSKAREIRSAQASLTFAPNNVNTRIFRGSLLGDLSGPVRRRIVHNDDVKIQIKSTQGR
jgi:hypothetical protein